MFISDKIVSGRAAGIVIYILSIFSACSFGRVYGAALSESNAPRPVCIYYMSNAVRSQPDNDEGGDQLLDDGTVLCGSPSDYCFSFWKISSSNATEYEGNGEVLSDTPGFSWLARGCFKNAESCKQEKCVATEKEVESNYFCCCKGEKCNDKISFKEIPIQPKSEAEYADVGTSGGYLNNSLYITGALFVLVVFFLMAAFTKYLRNRRNKKLISEAPLNFDKSPTSPCIDLNNIEFLEELGHGRYGTVRKALLGDEEVAVKLFISHHKSSFVNEKYIYSLPLMEHPNLLSFLGGGEIIGPDKNPYLGLVLSYCPQGKLSTYLQHNTLDWQSFCRIVISTVKGLGHLHSDNRKGDLIKPCVAHRDFNTRNILLKEDMSCVVSDLGFAIHTQGAKFYVNGEEQLAEMASLTDVGTLRYMAPEVLEGAVNLRDCETSLKQIDIYALGLVLWEIASRCHDLYQGTPTPAYALPFQEEIGLHPLFEQMQVLVARNKARPLFPVFWKDSNPAIRQLKETIADCWDNDAEARLSAMCVEKRLQELTQLWERYKNSLGVNGVSPTTNPSSGGVMLKSGAGNNRDNFIISNELCLPKDKYTREGSLSENTYDTTVPFSPADNNSRMIGKNHLVKAVQVSLPQMLQPHQGRNPCLERNTATEASLDNNQRTLIEASHKFHYTNTDYGMTNVNFAEMLETQHGLDSDLLMNEHLMPLINSLLPSSQQPPAPPEAPLVSIPVLPSIPYVQNEIENHKRPNVPKETPSTWKKWKAAWELKLGALLPRRRNLSEDEEHQNILHTPTSSSFSEPPTPLAPFQVTLGGPSPLQQTQVYMTHGAPHTVLSKEFNYAPLNTQTLPNINTTPVVAETEIGIAMLQHRRGLAPVVRSRQGSKDSGINKSSDNSVSLADTDSSQDHVRRPTTLLLQQRREKRFLSSQAATSDDDYGSDDVAFREQVKLRKPKQRIKTPRALPLMPRLSLYDDSVMAGKGLQSLLEPNLSRSLPLNMNTIGEAKDKRHSTADKSSGSSSINVKEKNWRSDSSSSGNSTSESSVNEEMSHAHKMKASEVQQFNPALVAHV